MEGANILRVKLRRDLFQIDVGAERRNIKVILVNFNDGLNIFWLEWWTPLRRLASPPRILLLLLFGAVFFRNRVWLDMDLLHDGDHEIVKIRHLPGVLGIHWSDDCKLVRILIDWEADALSVHADFLAFVLVGVDLIKIWLRWPLILLLDHLLARWCSCLFGGFALGISLPRLQRIPLVIELAWCLSFGLWHKL